MADDFQPRFVDLVRNYSTTEGTGSFVLGSAVTGYQSFLTAIQPGESFYYSAIGVEKPQEAEVGRGTMRADGTISRDPIGGSLTDFSSGNKTIALVAASEWHEDVQAQMATTVSYAASRAELAGQSDTARPVLLAEPGREGTFVFDPSDLAAKVSADPAQGIYIAPSSEPTGAAGAWTRRYSGPVEARWFGAVGDGVANDTAAVQAALTYFESAGGGELKLGAGTFGIQGTLLLFATDVTINAHGATMIALDGSSIPMLYIGGDRTRVFGGTWKVPHAGSRQFDVEGRDCRLDKCVIQHDPIADETQMYVRFGADGFRMTNCSLTGATDGIVLEASNVLVMGNSFGGHRPGGGDDAIAIKAIQGIAENIGIIGNKFENHAFFVSIGSQVGVLGANDPTYSRQVRNVTITNNSGQACAGMLYIKPGAVGAYDYRDGTVEGVTLSDNTLYDVAGAKMRQPIAITPARGGRVRNIKGKNNIAVGRVLDDGGRIVGMDLFNIDQSAASPGCNAPSISDIDVQLTLLDPNDGVALGTPGVSGSPFDYGVGVNNQTSTHGTMSGITLDVEVNGTKFSGIAIGPGLDDVVTVRRAKLSSINTSASSTNAGINILSRVKVGQEVTIRMAAGNPYRLASGTTAEISSEVDNVFFVESLPPGTDQIRRPWAASKSVFVHKVDLLNATTISKSADDTNYTQFEFRKNSGNIFASASSRLTGGQEFPADTYNTVLLAREISNSASQTQCFFAKGDVLYCNKNDFGTGNLVNRAYMRVHWAPF